MEIYLVQHGMSKTEAEDPERPLTDRGREEVRVVARHAAALGLPVAEVRHSGKLRARQTAEVLAEHLSPSRGVREVQGLSPNDDPTKAQSELLAAKEPIMLVGHLPHLSRLASLLLVGDPGREIIRFRYAAIVCLERSDSTWLLRWLLTPDLASAASTR